MPNQPRNLYSFILIQATVTMSFFLQSSLFLFSLSLDCQQPLELAFHIKQMVVRVVPLLQSDAWHPKEIPTIQALLGERQINYQPPVWDYDYMQSLKCEYVVWILFLLFLFLVLRSRSIWYRLKKNE